MDNEEYTVISDKTQMAPEEVTVQVKITETVQTIQITSVSQIDQDIADIDTSLGTLNDRRQVLVDRKTAIQGIVQ